MDKNILISFLKQNAVINAHSLPYTAQYLSFRVKTQAHLGDDPIDSMACLLADRILTDAKIIRSLEKQLGE